MYQLSDPERELYVSFCCLTPMPFTFTFTQGNQRWGGRGTKIVSSCALRNPHSSTVAHCFRESVEAKAENNQGTTASFDRIATGKPSNFLTATTFMQDKLQVLHLAGKALAIWIRMSCGRLAEKRSHGLSLCRCDWTTVALSDILFEHTWRCFLGLPSPSYVSIED